MPLPGGAADKFGNRYEGIWTVQCIVDILAGRADSIRLEPPGEEGEGIEFWLKCGNEIQCHQVKRQNASGHWTIADLGNKGILGHFWNKLQYPSASCVFVSTNSAYPLEELSDRSKRSASLYEFNHEFVKAQSIYDAFTELRLRWNNCTDQEAYSALQRISIETISERSLRTTTERELGILVDGNPANAVDVLAQFALDKVHHELNVDDIWKHLEGRGFLRSKIVKADPVAGDFTYPTPLYFVGRAKTLAELDKAIVNNSTIVVGGVAGIGKTYLVSRYIENIDVSRTVLWFDCGAYEQTEKVLVRLAEFFGYKFGDEALLGLLRSPLDDEQRRMEMAAQLCDKYECTLVLDSLDPEIHKTLLIFIEECNRIFRRGRILITTRTSPEFATVINPVYRLIVPPLTREDGIQLMRHYLMRLGLEIYPEELLKEAYDRVEGHPYFLRALIVLSETYPLSDILRSLPQLTLQIQRYLQEQVFLQLTKDAIDLIARLSLLRVPFTLAAIQRFDTSPTSADSFDLLLRKFLVTRQSRRSSLYEIHDLVREYGQRQLSNEQIRLTHILATDYYEALDQKTYSDMMEMIYHSLEADLRERAAQTGEYLVSHALHQGLFDLVIDYTSQLFRDQRAENWAVVYFGRGRALRFKNRFAEALECYEKALECSHDKHLTDGAKLEIASMLTLLGERDNRENDIVKAKKLYEQLSQSRSIETQVAGLAALGYLNIKGEEQKTGIKLLGKALNLAEEAHLTRSSMQIYLGLGIAYAHKDNKKAAQYLEQAYKLRQETYSQYGEQDTEMEYYLFDALASVYSAQKRFEDAVKASVECVNIDRKLNLQKRLAHSLFQLGKDNCFLRRYDKAKAALQESLTLVRKLEISGEPKSATLEWLATALWHCWEFENAIESILEHIYLNQHSKEFSTKHIVIREADLEPGEKSGSVPVTSASPI